MAYAEGFAVAVSTDIVAADATLPALLDELLRAGAAVANASLTEVAAGLVLFAAGVAAARILRVRARPGSGEYKSEVPSPAVGA